MENVIDLGYPGIENDFLTVMAVLPYRKKRNILLSREERKYDRKLANLVVVIEHTTCRIKKYEIMDTKFRNRLRRHDCISKQSLRCN